MNDNYDEKGEEDYGSRSRREDDEKFIRHLEQAHQIVSEWPDWKRYILG